MVGAACGEFKKISAHLNFFLEKQNKRCIRDYNIGFIPNICNIIMAIKPKSAEFISDSESEPEVEYERDEYVKQY